MEGLTILGGKGFVGGHYVKDHYDAAVGNIVSVNSKYDYKTYSPDVLYLISTNHNFNIFDKPYLDIDTNLMVLVETLENWRKSKNCGVFNFISSWLVYGNQDTISGVPETAPCNPKGFYAITKRCAEQLLISYCEAYKLSYRILRLSNVVGPGDNKVSAQKNVLQHMINKLSRNEDIEVYGDGMFFRDYTHVSDCSKAIELVITKGDHNSIYNIGNGRTWPFKRIINYAHEELKSTGKIVYVAPKDFQKQVVVTSFYMDTEKLVSLGYAPEYTEEKLYKALIQ